MSRKLPQLWAKKGGVQVSDVGFGFYVVNFESVADYERALFGGPWMINDHYVVIQEWRPHFRPEETILSTLRVWVRLPGIPFEYFDRTILKIIGDRIGRTVRIDHTTLEGSRGNFARICVEVDLSKPLLSKYRLRRRVRRIEYEGLHTICFNCGCYGHKDEFCKQAPEAESIVNQTTSFANPIFQEVAREDTRPEVDEDFGPWMQVKKSRRKPISRTEAVPSGGRPAKDAGKGNSFSVLADMDSPADVEGKLPRNKAQSSININEELLEDDLESADKENNNPESGEPLLPAGFVKDSSSGIILGQGTSFQGPSLLRTPPSMGLAGVALQDDPFPAPGLGGNGSSPHLGPSAKPQVPLSSTGASVALVEDLLPPTAPTSHFPLKKAPLVAKIAKSTKVKAKDSSGAKNSKLKDGSASSANKEGPMAMEVL
ncbi:hypothetical protein LINPERHAP2_LOCUS8458 [Linum perenne]